jgi:hypothetical protein
MSRSFLSCILIGFDITTGLFWYIYDPKCLNDQVGSLFVKIQYRI